MVVSGRGKFIQNFLLFIQRLFDWRNRKPFGYRSVLLVATDSFVGTQSGVSDILIDTSRFEVPDRRQSSIRELSTNGLGHIEMLSDIPALLDFVQSESQYQPKHHFCGAPLKPDFQVDYPSHLKSEGGALAASTAQKLRPPKLSELIRVVTLGEEFIAMHYE